MTIEIVEIDLKSVGAITQARVTLAQTISPDPSKTRPDIYLNTVEKAEKAHLIEIQQERIRKQLQRAILDEPNFIVFPELSIPWGMQEDLQAFAEKHHVYIIGGLMYGPEYENACAVFTPFKDIVIPLQRKLYRAPIEDQRVKTGNKILVFKNSGFGTFVAIICYDLTSLELNNEIRRHDVNLLFLPTFNHAVHLFDDVSSGQCYILYTYICLCNAAGINLGNSAIYGPVRVVEGSKLTQERVISKVQGIPETTLTSPVNIPNLCESINKFKNKQDVLPGYITPPADFREPGVFVSPYTPFGPAKDNFVGRETQIHEFWAHVQTNNHILILGPSGTGKSSLIRRLQTEPLVECRIGSIEVYDNERTFDFFRRLSAEILSRVETSKHEIQLRSALDTALDDILITSEMVAKYGFEKSAKVFIEAFHKLAQAITSQKVGKMLIFIDQAERLAWLEEEPEKQQHAIKILVRIMNELLNLRAPILFILAIREHDYDPLIALANDHLPARVVSIQKFSENDTILAIEKPLPPDITIEYGVSKQIATLSKGIPFFVQLLADTVFRRLGEQKVLDASIWAELHIKDQKDIFPIVMKALTPNEQRFVEFMGTRREYTVSVEDLIADLESEPDNFRHTADLLMGKNIIESLENNRFRFVHDQMKGFIQREWLAARMDNLAKLHSETETALQMFLVSPDDEVSISFNLPTIAMCCFKSLLLNDIENLQRILEQTASSNTYQLSNLYCVVSAIALKHVNYKIFIHMRSFMLTYFEKIKDYEKMAVVLAIGTTKINIENTKDVEHAISLLEKGGFEKSQKIIKHGLFQFVKNGMLGYYLQAIRWAAVINNSSLIISLVEKMVNNLETVQSIHCALPNEELLETGIFEWVEYERPSQLAQVVGFIGKLGDQQYYKVLHDKLIEVAIKEAKLMEQRKEYDGAYDSYKDTAELAEKMGNKTQRDELYERAIEAALKYAQQSEESREISDYYKDAAELAEKLDDKKRRDELYERAIEAVLKYAQQAEERKEYREIWDYYKNAAELAEKLGDKKRRDELYEGAIEAVLKYAQQAEESKEYREISDYYKEAVELAEKLDDKKRRDELYEGAIKAALKRAHINEEKSELLSASNDYLNAAVWMKSNGNREQSGKFFLKATETFFRGSGIYEKMASFLLSDMTVEIGSGLRVHDSDKGEDVTNLNRIITISKYCRIFYRRHPTLH